ncbi:hypothetical protein J6895_04692 [Nakaseomyces glabratus]|nr:hypothetical protein J6895_04692 [Nakaseomyces glabratus]
MYHLWVLCYLKCLNHMPHLLQSQLFIVHHVQLSLRDLGHPMFLLVLPRTRRHLDQCRFKAALRMMLP